MKNPMVYALIMIALFVCMSKQANTIYQVPFKYSKGCRAGLKQIRVTKAESIPNKPAIIHRCFYTGAKLIKVESFSFEKGFGLKHPVQATLFSWKGKRLSKIVVRSAFFGDGEVDKITITYH